MVLYLKKLQEAISNFKLKFMKAPTFVSFGMVVFLSLQLHGQQRTSTQNSKPVKDNSPRESMSTAADSLKMALNDAKTSFNTLFKGHKDTTTIMISDIDYEDPNLSVLKESLKKLKGVRGLSMEYESSTAFLKIAFKGKSTALWDELDALAKTPFKLVKAGDNELVLKVKHANSQ